MPISDAILGLVRRRRASAAPERETPPPAPQRRTESAAEKAPPAKRPEAGTIRAIVIDPQAKTVKETRLATSPGDARGGFGTQLDEKAVERLVGVEELEAIDLGDGQVVVVDPLRQSETVETWTLGEAAEPIAGVGVIVGYDPDADEYADATLTADAAREAVTWGDEDSEDARSELLANIVDRLERLDAKQLKRVNRRSRRPEGDDAGDDSGDERVKTSALCQLET